MRSKSGDGYPPIGPDVLPAARLDRDGNPVPITAPDKREALASVGADGFFVAADDERHSFKIGDQV